MELLEALALISYGLINLSAIPRIRKVWADMSTQGVSLLGSFMIWLGCLVIFGYFVSVREPIGMLGGVVNSLASGTVWAAQTYYRWRYGL